MKKTLLFLFFFTIAGCSSTPTSKKALLREEISLSSAIIKNIYSGNTMYLNTGETGFLKSDGATFYDSIKKITKGKWNIINDQICFNYENDDGTYCLNIEGSNIIHSGKKVTIKNGDTLNLEKKYYEYKKHTKENKRKQDIIKKQKIRAKKYRKNTTPVKKQIVSKNPQWLNRSGWVSFKNICLFKKTYIKNKNMKNANCNNRTMVTGKSILSSWAGEIVYLYYDKSRGSFSQPKIKITWTTKGGSYKCGQVIKKDQSQIVKFKHRSIKMKKCN